MSQESLNQIRPLLSQLTDSELQQVILLATTMRTRADKESDAIDWYNAISQALLSRIEWRVPPLKALPDNTQAQIRKTYFSLTDWFDQAFKPSLKKIERQWAFQWCAHLLADSLLERNRPLCLNGMLNATQEIPFIVDQSFPGYIQSGLLRMVLPKKGESYE